MKDSCKKKDCAYWRNTPIGDSHKRCVTCCRSAWIPKGDKDNYKPKAREYALRDSEHVQPPCSPVPVGWQCPRCGKGLAPWIPECNCHITISPNPTVQPHHSTGTGYPFPVPTITVCAKGFAMMNDVQPASMGTSETAGSGLVIGGRYPVRSDGSVRNTQEETHE